MTNHNFLPALADSILTEGNDSFGAVLRACHAGARLAGAAGVRAAAAAHTFALWADVSSLVGAE